MFVFSETIHLSHLTNQQFNACESSVAFRSRETQITDISYTCAYVCTSFFVRTPRDNELPIKTKSLNSNTAWLWVARSCQNVLPLLLKCTFWSRPNSGTTSKLMRYLVTLAVWGTCCLLISLEISFQPSHHWARCHWSLSNYSCQSWQISGCYHISHLKTESKKFILRKWSSKYQVAINMSLIL